MTQEFSQHSRNAAFFIGLFVFGILALGIHPTPAVAAIVCEGISWHWQPQDLRCDERTNDEVGVRIQQYLDTARNSGEDYSLAYDELDRLIIVACFNGNVVWVTYEPPSAPATPAPLADQPIINPNSNNDGSGGTSGGTTPTPPSCPANAHAEGAQCICNAGYVLSGSACVANQCNDGIDNDGNGSADFAGAAGLPPDAGCSSLNDNDESVPDAELTLTPDKKIVKPGTAVTLTWGAAHIKNGSCALRGDNDESWNLPAGEGGGVGGSQLTGKLTAETRFTLMCVSLKTNSAISASTVVKVAPSFNEF